MPKNQTTLIRRLLPTAHKKLLEREIHAYFEKVTGNALVIGAGIVPYESLLPNASSIYKTDVERHGDIDKIVDAHKLPFDDSVFDFFIAIEVFEHLQNPILATAEMIRVLRPGGRAVISVPFMFRVHGDPHDFHRFTARGLETLFSDFSCIRIQPFGNRLHVVFDILSTSSRILVALRAFSHMFSVSLFKTPSIDCPSGYIIELIK